MVTHPAKYSPKIMDEAAKIIWQDRMRHRFDPYLILDPMAGTGRVHLLQERIHCRTYGVELEPEWAEMDPRTIRGNALHLPFRNNTFNCIFVSPVYGNRMSDHHKANDSSRRHSYTHDIGHELHPDNSGTLYFWQPLYREFHIYTWAEAIRVLKPLGLFIINTKDFYRTVKGVRQREYVSAWHWTTLNQLGLKMMDVVRVDCPGMKFGANSDRVAEGESLGIFRKPLDKLVQ